MEWLINNWYVIVFAIIVAFGIYTIITDKEKVKEWLKWAVSMAEIDLGSGTGQLKLRQVYDMFIERFPVFSKLIPFKLFSKWVDYALEFLKTQLENNDKIKELVIGI